MQENFNLSVFNKFNISAQSKELEQATEGVGKVIDATMSGIFFEGDNTATVKKEWEIKFQSYNCF